jgi:ATP-dependent protease ClpP protease subunit
MRPADFRGFKSEVTVVGNLLYLYGGVGIDFMAADVVPAIAQLRGRPVILAVNSHGGFVTDAQAIYSEAERHGNVTARIDGLAASAASFIPMACRKVLMNSTALFLLHRPWTSTSGNAADLRRTAAALDAAGQALVTGYARKSKLSTERILELMDSEAWLTAPQCVELGFADAIEESPQPLAAAACARPEVGFGWDAVISKLHKRPAAIAGFSPGGARDDPA